MCGLVLLLSLSFLLINARHIRWSSWRIATVYWQYFSFVIISPKFRKPWWITLIISFEANLAVELDRGTILLSRLLSRIYSSLHVTIRSRNGSFLLRKMRDGAISKRRFFGIYLAFLTTQFLASGWITPQIRLIQNSCT